MISLEKLKIFTPLQKLPKNVGDLGKLIVAKGFEKLPKVQSGHTEKHTQNYSRLILEEALNIMTARLSHSEIDNTNIVMHKYLPG